MKKTVITALAFVLFLPAALLPYGLTLQKSVSPPYGYLGDTVTFCLSITPDPVSSGAKADIMWVIDATASMDKGIGRIKTNISYFTSTLASNGVDYRQGLVIFRDSVGPPPFYDIEPDINYGFASDDAQFMSWVNGIVPAGGGDPPETGLEGLLDANTVAWRAGASKTMILVTDALVKADDLPDANERGPHSLTYTAAALKSQGVRVHTVCNDFAGNKGNPRDISTLTGGAWLNYDSSAASWQAFMTALGSEVTGYTNVVVTDTLPPELTLAGGIGAACGADISGNNLSWSIASLWGNDTSQLCCFPAVITSIFSGTVTNTAYVSADNVSDTASNSVTIFFATPTITPSITPTSTITPTITPTAPPVELSWTGAYPNPASTRAHVLFRISSAHEVELTAYTVSGEIVDRDRMQAHEGQNAWSWDLRNSSQKRCASGVYIIRIYVNDEAYKKEHEVWGKLSVVN